MTSLRRSGLALVLFLASTLAASSASAERFTCDVGDDGGRFCSPEPADAPACDDRRDCISHAGTEDWYCLATDTRSPDALECLAACTTIFGCNAAEDCPALLGQTGTCQPAEDSTTISVCTYRGATAPNRRITYCTDGGEHPQAAMFAACHTLPRDAGDPAIYTADYYEGDCDGDGCANGADNDPCTPPDDGGACLIVGAPARSPFCPPPPPVACDLAGASAVCEDARPCTNIGEACDGSSTCEDGWSDGPRCRPSCSTLILCNGLSGAGGPSDPCPPYNGRDGACLPLPMPSPFADYPRYGGICVYGFFDDGSCSAMSVTSNCFVDPTTSTTSADFFRGDCDSDGVQNGCDSMRCVAGSEGDTCVSVPGEGCGASFPEPDAGVVDAGSSLDDGASQDQDAGSDAGAGGDAGSASFDAGGSAVDAAGGSFSGGGGCRCSAAGGDRGGVAGLGLLALTAFAIGRRRRRGV